MAKLRYMEYARDCESCVHFFGHSGCEKCADCNDCTIGPHCPCLEKPADNEKTCPYYKEEK